MTWFQSVDAKIPFSSRWAVGDLLSYDEKEALEVQALWDSEQAERDRVQQETRDSKQQQETRSGFPKDHPVPEDHVALEELIRRRDNRMPERERKRER